MLSFRHRVHPGTNIPALTTGSVAREIQSEYYRSSQECSWAFWHDKYLKIVVPITAFLPATSSFLLITEVFSTMRNDFGRGSWRANFFFTSCTSIDSRAKCLTKTNTAPKRAAPTDAVLSILLCRKGGFLKSSSEGVTVEMLNSGHYVRLQRRLCKVVGSLCEAINTCQTSNSLWVDVIFGWFLGGRNNMSLFIFLGGDDLGLLVFDVSELQAVLVQYTRTEHNIIDSFHRLHP